MDCLQNTVKQGFGNPLKNTTLDTKFFCILCEFYIRNLYKLCFFDTIANEICCMLKSEPIRPGRRIQIIYIVYEYIFKINIHILHTYTTFFKKLSCTEKN